MKTTAGNVEVGLTTSSKDVARADGLFVRVFHV
jgi:hypothetical protein